MVVFRSEDKRCFSIISALRGERNRLFRLRDAVGRVILGKTQDGRSTSMKTTQDFDRISIGVFPTPVQKLDNVSRLLGTQVYVKRDDLTGLGLGGNKVRKLEYLLADAKAQGAEVVFTTGGAQST